MRGRLETSLSRAASPGRAGRGCRGCRACRAGL